MSGISPASPEMPGTPSVRQHDFQVLAKHVLYPSLLPDPVCFRSPFSFSGMNVGRIDLVLFNFNFVIHYS